MLKLDDRKNKFLHFHPCHKKAPDTVTTTIKIGTDTINNSFSAKNLSVLLDDIMFLSPYITSICNVANIHLYRLACIRKYLTLDALKMAVHALVS